MQPCAKAVDGQTVVLAAAGDGKTQSLTCDRVIAPSEVYSLPAYLEGSCLIFDDEPLTQYIACRAPCR